MQLPVLGFTRGALQLYIRIERLHVGNGKKKKKNRQQAETTLTRSGQLTEAGILKYIGNPQISPLSLSYRVSTLR